MTPGLSSGKLSEGLYSFNILVQDSEGGSSGSATLIYPANFGIDKNNPVLTITEPPADVFKNSDFIMKGSATDQVNISSVKIYINNQGETNPRLASLDGDNWIYNIPVSTESLDGQLSIKVVATDGSGKSDTESITYYVDGSNPVIDETKIIIPSKLNQTVLISGSATDNKLSKVEYKVETEEWHMATLVGSSWSFNFDTTPYYPKSTKTLYIKATDGADNFTLVSKNLEIDKDSDKPIITFKTPDSTNNSFSGTISFWVELEDDDGIEKDSIVLTIKDLDSNQVDDIVINKDSSGFNSLFDGRNPGTFRYSLPGLSPDGNYSVTLDVKDINGVEADTQVINYVSDSVGPEIFVNNDFDGVTHVKDNFTISGTASDGMSGVKEITVSAKFSSLSEAVVYKYPFSSDVEESYEELLFDSETGIWSCNVSVSSIVSGNEDPLTLSINAIDGSSNPSGIITRNLIVDKKDPEEKPLTSVSQDLNGIVVLTGEISDDNLTAVQIKIGTSDWESVTEGLHLWKYKLNTVPLNSNTNVLVRGIDKAGNNTSTSYSITVNQSKDIPVFTFDDSIDSSLEDAIATDNVFSQTDFIGGTVIDDDGIKSGSIVLKLYDGSALVKEIPATETFNNGSRVDWKVALNNNSDGRGVLSQGVYNFDVTVKDDYTKKN